MDGKESREGVSSQIVRGRLRRWQGNAPQHGRVRTKGLAAGEGDDEDELRGRRRGVPSLRVPSAACADSSDFLNRAARAPPAAASSVA